jgi:hypothetical protein
MCLEDDLGRVEEHVAEAHRLGQRQKGLIFRLRVAALTPGMHKEYFGYWNLIWGDLRNTENALEQT